MGGGRHAKELAKLKVGNNYSQDQLSMGGSKSDMLIDQYLT